MITVNNVLVATDFGGASEAALDFGADLARRLGATLHLVHVAVANDTGAQGRLEAIAAALAPVVIRPVVIPSSSTAAALLAYARTHEIDLIVAGTDGRDGVRSLLDFFMGSVAQNLVRNAPCPVMTMRGPVGAAA